MVKGFFDQLGCQESKVYDVGITEWGQQGNPVVYAKCDEGAEKTLVIYWMYDTMPVTQPDLWKAPPFEGRLVEQAPFKKVLIGRGATNSKGPQMVRVERADVHQGGDRQAAGEHHLRRGRRRGAHVDGSRTFVQGAPRALQGRRRDVSLRRPGRPGRWLGRFVLRRADDQRREVGARTELQRYPRRQQAHGRQRRPGVTSRCCRRSSTRTPTRC